LKFGRLLPTFGEDGARVRLLERAAEEAGAARRLAIFDQETGLYAAWYLERRFAEEAERSSRYGRAMSAIVFQGSRVGAALVTDPIAQWLAEKVRGCDFAASIGDSRYFLLMPETDAVGALSLRNRFAGAFPTAKTGIALFPTDGTTFSQIRDKAISRLDGPTAAPVFLVSAGAGR
jgi:GGDEF domain-containing protein